MIQRQWQQMASPVIWLIDAEYTPEWFESAEHNLKRLFGEVESRLSRFREDSELTHLNRSLGQWVVVSPCLYQALSLAWRAWRRTDGFFDPRVASDLERLGYHGAPLPQVSAQDLNQPWLERDPRPYRVRIWAPIDLGGVGKSLAVHWGAALMQREAKRRHNSLPPMLLNAGGDIEMWGGSVPEPDGWLVGVEHPLLDSEMGAVIRFRGPGAICTSSVKRNRWDHEGRRLHHLIDPRTHEPAAGGLISVTVSHTVPTWAEIWSKTLLLHGAGNIRRLAEGLGITAWWFDEDGRLGVTKEAQNQTVWIHP